MSGLGQRLATVALAVTAWSLSSCSVGKGDGEVRSELLRARNCYEGPYNLKPTFFGTNPYRDTQTIRLQRTDEMIDNADGVQLLIRDTDKVRERLGQPVRVGMPPGVQPPGVPIVPDPDPPLVQLTLYLHETCHGQNVALYSVSGTITFTHLFSGDRNEGDADDRLTEATFENIEVADPRDQPPQGGDIPAESRSKLSGWFRFYFERGQPAQPFP